MKFLEECDRYLARFSDDRFYFVLVAAFTAVIAGLLSVFVVDLNRNFLVYAADTSVYHNVLVNFLHGNGFRDTAYSGPNLLGQHAAFVLVLIAPLYALLPSVDMLFVLQVWVVYSAVLPLYLIAREILRKPALAFVVAMLGLGSPLLLQMAAAPFHTESGILTFVLWSYFFYRRNHAAGFWIGFALAISCAEQAALLYLTMGLALSSIDDGLAWRKRYAKYALIGALAWLIFAMGVLIPFMYRPGQLNLMRYHYSQWGIDSASGLLLALMRDPLHVLYYLFTPQRWMHVVGLVGLPLLLVLLSPRFLVRLTPFPIFFLMSDHEFFLNFHAYYFQFAFMAAYLTLINLMAGWQLSARLGTALLAIALAANLLFLLPQAGYFYGLAADKDEDLSAALHTVFKTLPPEAGVYCPVRYCAYLSNRTNIVVGDLRDENLDFNARLDQEFNYTDVHPAQIDYIVCDILNDQCGSRLAGLDPDMAKNRSANIDRYVHSGEWQIFWNQSDVVILRRAGK